MDDRRSFIKLLGATAAGLVMDPEKLLWRPGQKTIFVPPIIQQPLIPKYYTVSILLAPPQFDYYQKGDELFQYERKYKVMESQIIGYALDDAVPVY